MQREYMKKRAAVYTYNSVFPFGSTSTSARTVYKKTSTTWNATAVIALTGGNGILDCCVPSPTFEETIGRLRRTVLALG